MNKYSPSNLLLKADMVAFGGFVRSQKNEKALVCEGVSKAEKTI